MNGLLKYLLWVALAAFYTKTFAQQMPALVPLPAKVEWHNARYSGAPQAIAFPEGEKWKKVAEMWQQALATAGAGELSLGIETVKAIRITSDTALGREAYRLAITHRAIVVQAGAPAGAFYALQTFLQLIPKEFTPSNWQLPACTIADEPRFEWRGLHLDVSRHFFPVSFIEKYIDLLARHKMNVFHWHLTDDQGWRLEIKRFPELTAVAACRDSTLIGHYSDTPRRYDTARYCHFYTQEEVKHLVQYAADRFVTIVPEIEMPGHSSAVLAAYPHLGCTGGPYATEGLWGVFDDVLCAGNDATFQFIDGVLEEVCALFPGEYIHVGGDECPKTRWQACAKCQERRKKESLPDEHALQSYFIGRAETMLARRGKKLIGWDEILEGGLPPSAAVMSWRGTEGGIAAARAGHSAVMCPGSHCYFDHYQGDPALEPLAIGGYTPLEKVYQYDPVPEGLSQAEARFILGAQGNVWTEYIATGSQVEYMAWPRAAALAEVLWTPAAQRAWPDFARRLVGHLSRLDALGVHYAPSLWYVDAGVDSSGLVSLQCPAPEGNIEYRLDSTAEWQIYRGAFGLHHTCTVEARAGKGPVFRMPYVHHKAVNRPYTLTEIPKRYTGGGFRALTDGRQGHIRSWGQWAGLFGGNFDPVIDMGKKGPYSRIVVQFLHQPGSWIHAPERVEVAVSEDGYFFNTVAQHILDRRGLGEASIVPVEVEFSPQTARYVRVMVKNAGKIPPDNAGAGSDAWLFMDEVVVE